MPKKLTPTIPKIKHGCVVWKATTLGKAKKKPGVYRLQNRRKSGSADIVIKSDGTMVYVNDEVIDEATAHTFPDSQPVWETDIPVPDMITKLH